MSKTDILHNINLDKKYIDKNDLKDNDGAGIILISSNDPISTLTRSIIKQEFTSIGFYYNSSITGIQKIQLIIVDIFGVKTPDWLNPNDSIDDIINNPLINNIAIKKLKPIYNSDGSIDQLKTKLLKSNFRSVIAEVISLSSGYSIRESIAQLFGYNLKLSDNSDKKCMTAIEMVNKVIYLLGKWDDVPENNSINLNTLESLKPPDIENSNAKAKVQLMGYIGSSFNQQFIPNPTIHNKQIQSYIVPNKLFDDLLYLTLPKHDAVSEELSIINSLNIYKSYITKSISIFIDMLLLDQEFFRVVLSGIHEGKLRYNFELPLLKELFKDSIFNHHSTINTLFSSSPISSEQFLSFIKNLHLDISKYNTIFNDNLILSTPIPPSSDKSLILCSSSFSSSISTIHSTLSSLINNISTNNQPFFDLNLIINSFNNILSSTNSNLTPLPIINDNTSYNIIPSPIIASINTNFNDKLPFSLSSGQKIYIPLRNPDLSSFDRSILLEILQLIDHTISSDNQYKYDHIRSLIVNELSSR